MNGRSVVVFAGAASGNDPIYAQDAYEVGKLLAQHGLGLVFGGGASGMMGAVANGHADHGGVPLGVFPSCLSNGLFDRCEKIETIDIHTRKARMYEADIAIVLPGGMGTLDEMYEFLTWNSIQVHDKHLVVLNTRCFFRNILAHAHAAEEEGFMSSDCNGRLLVSMNATQVVSRVCEVLGMDKEKEDQSVAA